MIPRLTSSLFRRFASVLLLVSALAGQEPEAPPPAPPPDERNGPKFPPRLEKEEEEGHPRKPRMFKDDGERPPRGNRGDLSLGKLSREERERVRVAMGKAWANAEVQAARNRLQAATQEYREALRLALEKEDPGISALMEKARPPDMPLEGMPPYAHGFVRELFQKLDEAERKDIPAVVQEIFKNSEVIKAVEGMAALKEEDRQTAGRALRKILRKTLVQFKPEWDKKLRDEEDKK